MSKLLDIAEELENVACDLDDEHLIVLSRFLRQRIAMPEAYCAALGETCSGKSAILNSVVDMNILPVQGVPSTGAVAELYSDSAAKEPSYFVINKNATMEALDEETFLELAVRPDENTERLRAVIPPHLDGLAGVHLFDTPGYGSLVDEHEEVLENFLPNCDAVIYVVSHRVGFQQDDYDFLRHLKELSRDGIPFYLVINRVPASAGLQDRRVREIHQNVGAFLGDADVPLFLIPNTPVRDGIIGSPQIAALREAVVQDLNSPHRKSQLEQAYLSYLADMSDTLRSEAERRLRDIEMDEEERAALQKETDDFLERLSGTVPNIIRPGFERLCESTPRRVAQSGNAIRKIVTEAIEKESAANKDQTIAYIRSHLVKSAARDEARELEEYLRIELEAIAQDAEDYITTAVAHFESSIEVRFGSATMEAVQRAGTGILSRVLTSGLTQFFAAYGGAAGAGAGIANAASHWLKVVGNWFGKTFTRETHNTLKHVLAKIGMTSTRTLGALVGGAIEVVVVWVDYGTWKPRLIAEVKKSIGTWVTETTELVETELAKLEKQNTELIGQIVEQYKAVMDTKDVPQENPARLREMISRLDEIDRRISA